MSPLRRARVAFAAAWRTRAVVGGAGLDALLVAPPPGVAPTSADVDALATVDDALRAIRLLARTRAWRNTCLFRAVAECLVLRALGRPAVLRLGVARGATDDVEAHAWVECAGMSCRTADGGEDARFARLQHA